MSDELKIVDISKINIEDGFNPRNAELIEEIDAELVDSIKASGIHVPLHVRRKGDDYYLIAGERRFRAACLAEIAYVPVIDHGQIDDAFAHEIAFAENFARKELTPLEASKAAALLVEQFNGDYHKAAAVLGKSVSWVRQRVRVMTCIDSDILDEIQEMHPYFTTSHLQVMASFSRDMQEELLVEINGETNITVSRLELIASEMMHRLEHAPWPVDQQIDNIMACSKCRFRTSVEPGLFDDIVKDSTESDRCTNHKCWQLKKTAWLKMCFEKEKSKYPELKLASSKHTGYYADCEYRDNFGMSPMNNQKLFKKTGVGKKPVMCVDDTGFAEVMFVKQEPEIDSQVDHGKTVPKTQQQKQAALDSKRWCFVCQNIWEKISNFTIHDFALKEEPIRSLNIFALAATFGVPINYRQRSTRQLGDWGFFDEIIAESPARIALEIFDRIKEPLCEQVYYNGPITQIPEYKIEAAKRIAGLFDIDIDEMFELACKKIKTPKSWSDETWK